MVYFLDMLKRSDRDIIVKLCLLRGHSNRSDGGNSEMTKSLLTIKSRAVTLQVPRAR